MNDYQLVRVENKVKLELSMFLMYRFGKTIRICIRDFGSPSTMAIQRNPLKDLRYH